MPDLSLPHLCFSVDHDRAAALAQFYTSFGHPALYAIVANGVLWVGPIA
jgi:hypothetical protein